MKTICLFDLDGTLTDSREGITKSARYALEAFGVAVPSLDSLGHFLGPPLHDSFRHTYGFSEADAHAAVAKYREYYAQTGMFENAVYPGVMAMLAALREAGVVVGMATSKAEMYAKRIAGHFGLAPNFAVIAGSEMDGTRSHKREVIRHALAQLGASPGESTRVLMVGDRKFDILGAQETGLESVAVTWGYAPEGELEAANPTFLAHAPADIGRLIMQI